MSWVKAVICTFGALIAPVKPLLIASLVMVVLDSVSGIMAAKKRGEKITSAGLRRTISKGLVYTVAILAAFVAEKYLLSELLPVSKLAAGAIGLVELKSCLENLNVVAGGNLFSAIVSKLGSKNDKTQAAVSEVAEKKD